jgi:hypothetical protein
MDPRVDTGMFPTAVDTVDFDRYCDHSLSDADLSGILDRLLLCEVINSWMANYLV